MLFKVPNSVMTYETQSSTDTFGYIKCYNTFSVTKCTSDKYNKKVHCTTKSFFVLVII